LRILHLSHDSLPDWRVEKSALTGLHFGHQVSFAGAKISSSYKRNTFAKTYEINWSAKARYGVPFYWHSVKKQIDKVIRDARPDIVHAHNIFSAKMISEFKIPFVYDDHEYWSKSSLILDEMENQDIKKYSSPKSAVNLLTRRLRETARGQINRHLAKLWTKWEKELVSSTPTITVSESIAYELKLIGNNLANNVYVVPNFPISSEVKNIKLPKRFIKISSVYAGNDGQNKLKFPQKDIDGFIDLFDTEDLGFLNIVGWEGESLSNKISYKGLLSRESMFDEMSKNSIGLIPWKNHWSHMYSSPNKAYEYAHAGLFVMCTSSLKPVTKYLQDNCLTFEDYDQMALQLSYFKDNMDELYQRRLRIFEFARSNLLWDNYEKYILRAYELSK
jgi:hypothetical protein